MEDYEGEKRYATYSRFAVASEDDKYRFKLWSYCGTAGNLVFANLNMLFKVSVYPPPAWYIDVCFAYCRGFAWRCCVSAIQRKGPR